MIKQRNEHRHRYQSSYYRFPYHNKYSFSYQYPPWIFAFAPPRVRNHQRCAMSTIGCCCTVQVADAGWCQVMPRSPFCWGGLFANAYCKSRAFLVVIIIPKESLENTIKSINTMGIYTVRGTPNCPLILMESISDISYPDSAQFLVGQLKKKISHWARGSAVEDLSELWRYAGRVKMKMVKCSSCSFLSRNPTCFFFILTTRMTLRQRTKVWSGSVRSKTISHLTWAQVGTIEIWMIWNQFGCLKKALCNIITFYKEGKANTIHVNIYLLRNQAVPVPITKISHSLPSQPASKAANK